MNTKLVLEFAKEAGIAAQSETSLHPNQLKFAELIIRECASMADMADPFEESVFILENFDLDVLKSNELDEAWFQAIK